MSTTNTVLFRLDVHNISTYQDLRFQLKRLAGPQ